MNFKTAFLVTAVLVMVSGTLRSLAQDTADTVEVGIVEHLDRIIPDGLSFRDETNKPVLLKEIIKRPTILSLIYFDCPGICPQLLAGIANVVKKTDMQLGKEYQIISVSFNPLDTPEKALDKKNSFLDKKSRPNGQYWNYLTGDSANIHALTNAVGYKFIQAGNDFIHPSCIMILSPEGKITRYLYGTTFLPFDVKMAVIEAQKGISRPTINRIMDFCFTYDPAGRRYSLAVTKVIATIIIFIVVVLSISLLIRSSRKKTKPKETIKPSNS
ncbi:MAG: SCO family protein [Bacteroidetes bacterium]|nr:SCO family protein [Bacteroidota bacterium]